MRTEPLFGGAPSHVVRQRLPQLLLQVLIIDKIAELDGLRLVEGDRARRRKKEALRARPAQEKQHARVGAEAGRGGGVTPSGRAHAFSVAATECSIAALDCAARAACFAFASSIRRLLMAAVAFSPSSGALAAVAAPPVDAPAAGAGAAAAGAGAGAAAGAGTAAAGLGAAEPGRCAGAAAF